MLLGPGHSATGCASLAVAQFSTGLARHFPGVLSLTMLWGLQAEKHICLGLLPTPNPVCMQKPFLFPGLQERHRAIQGPLC